VKRTANDVKSQKSKRDKGSGEDEKSKNATNGTHEALSHHSEALA
jgi:hypothetical protein